MAKSDDKKTPASDPKPASDTAGPETKTEAAPQPGVQQRQQVEVDDSRAVASYANFCRVTGTPEELIVDFGLNSEPMGVPTRPIVVTQRIILNHYTAKRFLQALQMSVQRHEGAFGVLETDVRKRLSPAVQQQMQQPER